MGIALVPAAADTAPSPYGRNLVINGGAETGVGAPDASTIVKASGWTTTGQFTEVQYGASGGFSDETSPGPADRGKNLFEGGNVEKSTAAQTIGFKAAGSDIDAGTVSCAFSAWIGGFGSQGDFATASVVFESASGAKLGRLALGAVTPAMRNSTTGSMREAVSGKVPSGTRKALVTIVFTRTDGEYNDGSADNISVVLTKA